MMSQRAKVKDSLGSGNISVGQHINALQALSNGQPVPYPVGGCTSCPNPVDP
jgi:hypothetical protein